MRLGLKALGGKIARGTPAATLGILGFILAHGRSLAGDVRDTSHEVIQLHLELAAASRQSLDLLVHLADGFLSGLRLIALAIAHERADVLGFGVAGCLQLFNLRDHRAALLVEREELLAVPRGLTIRHGGVNGIRILAHKANIQHGVSLGIVIVYFRIRSVYPSIAHESQSARKRTDSQRSAS